MVADRAVHSGALLDSHSLLGWLPGPSSRQSLPGLVQELPPGLGTFPLSPNVCLGSAQQLLGPWDCRWTTKFLCLLPLLLPAKPAPATLAPAAFTAPSS